jgi:hypothetical protein
LIGQEFTGGDFILLQGVDRFQRVKQENLCLRIDENIFYCVLVSVIEYGIKGMPDSSCDLDGFGKGMPIAELQDGIRFRIHPLAPDQVGEMDGLKTKLKKIKGAGLFHTLCLAVQFAFLTMVVGVTAIGLAAYAEPQLQVTTVLVLIIMIIERPFLIHHQQRVFGMPFDTVLPCSRYLFLCCKQGLGPIELRPISHAHYQNRSRQFHREQRYGVQGWELYQHCQKMSALCGKTTAIFISSNEVNPSLFGKFVDTRF